MSDDAYGMVMQAQDPASIDALERELGVGGAKAREATGTALGTILEGLKRRVQEKGDLGDLVEKYGTQEPRPGPKPVPDAAGLGLDDILGDILGKKQPEVGRRMERHAPVDGQSMKKILAFLLPIVLGAIAKSRQSSARPEQPSGQPEQPSGGGGLGDILKDMTDKFGQAAPKSAPKGGGGILESILDRDNDGDVDLGDIADMFGKR